MCVNFCFLCQFLRVTLQRQPCERLLASPKRQLIHEGPLTLLGSFALHHCFSHHMWQENNHPLQLLENQGWSLYVKKMIAQSHKIWILPTSWLFKYCINEYFPHEVPLLWIWWADWVFDQLKKLIERLLYHCQFSLNKSEEIKGIWLLQNILQNSWSLWV